MSKKYIKATLPDGRVVVALGHLEPYLRSQKAVLSEPTQEEIYESFPEERKKFHTPQMPASKAVAELRAMIADKENKYKALCAKYEALLAKRDELLKKLNKLEAKKEKATKGKSRS